MNILKEIYGYREMIFTLVRKDLRGRYLGTALGFLWTFVNPLLQLLVYNIVFSFVMPSGIDKYYLFLFVALIPWIFMSSCLTGGSTAIVGDSSLVTKIYFPREVLPIAYVTSCFVNMLLCFIVVFIIVFISGIPVNFFVWLYLPLVMAVEYIIGLGVAFISSAITVYFRDLQHILGIVAMAWQFLSPVLYSIDLVPEEARRVFMLNPMTPVITAYRDILYSARAPTMGTLTMAFCFGAVMIVFGFLLFGRLKRGFAEEL
ncbi:MAG: ABC transporter permease [Clostridiales bacterium]|jgi:ABC-2 type transport system permease protein|nr:ABC transporter permease [Clostridiales bacterium]